MRRRAEPGPPDVEGRLLGRAAEIARVLRRSGITGLLASPATSSAARQAQAEELRAVFEQLGPTFAKLGQILSTRPDLLPPEFVDELATLQEHVTPMTEAEVVSTMEGELGVPWEDVFEWIDPLPLAAGTIAQVHRATLETGDRVVVKVQRPTAATDIYRDLGLLELFAKKTASRPVFRQVVDLPAIVDHLSASLRRELDFRQEAANVERMRVLIAPYERLGVPAVHHDLSSARLLVLEEIEGVPIGAAPAGEIRQQAARQLVESFYQQILGDGFFHADPHPGNLKWWRDRVYLLDLGMTGEVDRHTRELLLVVLMAFSRRDVPFLTDTLLVLSADDRRGDIDIRGLQADLTVIVNRMAGATIREIQLGPVLQSMTEVAADHGVRLPSSLALAGKALAQMQLAAAQLDPDLDPFSVAGSFVLRDIASRVRGSLDGQSLLYEAQKLRLRTTRVVEALERLVGARPGASLQVRFSGTEGVEETIRRAGRRFAVAAVAGTCIVATGITADTAHVGSWVPILLGTVGGLLALVLVFDLLRG
ncbi:MAG: AarF/UbiB family protein [Gaiellales bacterium]